jgi:hypothetical protein
MAALVATQGPSHLLNWRSASDNFSDKGVSSTSDKGVSSTSDKGVSRREISHSAWQAGGERYRALLGKL